jgi:hypothetical protein
LSKKESASRRPAARQRRLACARGGLITFDRNRYSVPASFANRPVSLRIYPDQLVIVAEGHVICTHERIIERSHRQPRRVVYDWRHYLAVVQRNPPSRFACKPLPGNGSVAQWRALRGNARALPHVTGEDTAPAQRRSGA